LADNLAAGVLDPPGERRGIAERRHHRRRSGLECNVERLGVFLERPEYETDADARIAGLSQLPANCRGIYFARVDQAEPAGIGDRSRKAAAGRRTHWRKQDWMFDAQQTGESGFDDGHSKSFRPE
jgi:hypothetical protein